MRLVKFKYKKIFNNSELPVSFNDEENKYYYEMYKNGDMKAREYLIIHNLRLIFTTIKDIYNSDKYDLEELFCVGIVGLMNAIDSYDSSKGTKISFYMFRCIKYEILKFLRKDMGNDKYNVISLDESVRYGEDDSLTYGEILTFNDITIEEFFVEKDIDIYNKRVINDILNGLNERDRMVVMLYFGFIDGRVYKQREIAEIVGIGRANVSRILRSSLEKIKSRLLFEERNLCISKRKKLIRI